MIELLNNINMLHNRKKIIEESLSLIKQNKNKQNKITITEDPSFKYYPISYPIIPKIEQLINDHFDYNNAEIMAYVYISWNIKLELDCDILKFKVWLKNNENNNNKVIIGIEPKSKKIKGIYQNNYNIDVLLLEYDDTSLIRSTVIEPTLFPINKPSTYISGQQNNIITKKKNGINVHYIEANLGGINKHMDAIINIITNKIKTKTSQYTDIYLFRPGSERLDEEPDEKFNNIFRDQKINIKNTIIMPIKHSVHLTSFASDNYRGIPVITFFWDHIDNTFIGWDENSLGYLLK